MRAKIAENTEQFFADEGNLFALDHAEATDIILHGRDKGQEVTAVYHNEEGTKQGHVLATEGYNRGTYIRGRIGHGLSAVGRSNLVVGGALHPGSEDHEEQLDTLMNDIALRNTHAHLNLSVYTVPVVQTLYVDDGTSSEESGTFLATETIRAVTAGECGMERNLQKTRFYGKTEQVDELVDLATKVGLDRFAEELRQHGLAANGGMLLGAPMGSEQYIKQWCDRKVVVLLHKIATVMELPGEFAVEKFTAIVQGLRPKWTHAVARFYIAAPLVAKNFCTNGATDV